LPLWTFIGHAERKRSKKTEFLRRAAQIPGIYVPSLYEVSYKENGKYRQFCPNSPMFPKGQKSDRKNLDEAYYPDQFVVPSIETVHDRVMLEIFRGCIRGCRFLPGV
jgi:radical SAM superfamily enzyme YgiQ (UPF0313 family)